MLELLNFKVRILPLVLGCAVTFFGWMLYWLSINVTGGALGGALGVLAGTLFSLIFRRPELFFPLVLVLGLVGVILGIILIRKMHKLTFFLTGFVLGVLAGEPVILLLGRLGVLLFTPFYVDMLIKCGLGVIGGILVLYYNRYIITVLTAASGSLILMSSWQFKGDTARAMGRDAFFIKVLISLLVFIAGIFFQAWFLRKKRLPVEPPPPEK